MADESDAKQFPNIFLSLFLAEMMVHQICYCVRGHESYSISVDDITRRRNFSLVEIDSLLVVNSLVTRCKILLVTGCKIHSLRVAENVRCKKALATCCKIRSLLVAKIHWLFVGKFARCKKLIVARCKIRSLIIV